MTTLAPPISHPTSSSPSRRTSPSAPAPPASPVQRLRALGAEGFEAQAASLVPRDKDGHEQASRDRLPRGAERGRGGEVALAGEQDLYATPARIAESNAKLAAAGPRGSFIRLVGESSPFTITGQPLEHVVPSWVPRPQPGFQAGAQSANVGAKDSEGRGNADGMALWRDCGRASSAIMGAQSPFDRAAIYQRDDGREGAAHGTTDATAGASSPANQLSHELYLDAIPAFVGDDDHVAFLVEGVHFTRGADGARVPKLPRGVAEAKAMYRALGEVGMRAFDKAVGINAYADPEVGEGYLMTTEREMPGFAEGSKPTWNFHWAGVVMKDGSDTVTLEAFAVGEHEAKERGVPAFDYVDRDWSFELYGGVGADGEVAEPERTFHARHLASDTHGNRASTLRVRTD